MEIYSKIIVLCFGKRVARETKIEGGGIAVIGSPQLEPFERPP